MNRFLAAFSLLFFTSIANGQGLTDLNADIQRKIFQNAQRQAAQAEAFRNAQKVGHVGLDATTPMGQTRCLDPDAIKDGDLGYLEYWHTEVLSVVDKSKMIVRVTDKFFCLEWPTEKFVNDQEIRIMGPIKIDGTFTYTTVGGSTNKVRVIKFVDKEKAKEIDDLKRPKPASPKGKKAKKPASSQNYKVREWADKSGKFKIKATFVKFERGKVTLQKSDGSEVALPLGKLSKNDIQWVRENR